MKRGTFKQKKTTPLKRSYFKKKTLSEVKSQQAKKKATRATTKPKKRKEKTPARLKKDLDAVFSRFIRQKHADSNGMVACYTCGKVKHWKQQQNGHFVSRQYLATRWDENNCRVQDVGCNVFGNGQLLDFEEKLKKELGEETVEALKMKRHEITKLTPQWYKEQIAYYSEKLSTD